MAITSIHDIPDEDLRRGDTALTVLCFMDFATNPQRWWMGYGPLVTGGHTWKGTGDAIQISEASISYDGSSASMVRFTVPNASPEMIDRMEDQENEVNGRTCQLFYQAFSMTGGEGEHEGRLLGPPFAMFTGAMRDMTWSDEPGERVIELEAYSKMARQVRPPLGRWNDRDQKGRHPGDRGFEFLPTLHDKAVTWFRT